MGAVPGLVVVAGVVEERDARVARRPHHRQAGVAADALEGPPRAEGEPAHRQAGDAERPRVHGHGAGLTTSGRPCRTRRRRPASANPSRASARGSTRSIERADPGDVQHLGELQQLLPGAHRRADHAELEEEHPVEVGGRVRAARGAGDDERPARDATTSASGSRSPRRRSRRRRRRGPGSRAPVSKASSAPSSMARCCFSALRLVTQTRKPPARASMISGGGHPAAGALDEHGVARPRAALDEQHPVGGQPGRRQAGGLLEAQRRRLGHEVAPGHGHLLGQRALVALGQQRARGSSVSSPRPVGRADDASAR